MQNTELMLSTKEKAETKLLSLPGVTAVDVGYKYVDGKRTDKLAIRVHVKNKSDNVPAEQLVPKTIDGLPTDVIEGTYELQVIKVAAESAGVDTQRYEPILGGISIGPCRSVGGFVFAGTSGIMVTDVATDVPMLLSNFHVMCVDTGWKPGDTICQPSLIDTGACAADVVSRISRATVGGQVDCAVAEKTQRTSSPNIADIGPIAGTGAAVAGAPVRKRGRTTGLTAGTVDGVGGSVTIDYGAGIGSVTLTNQISIAPDLADSPTFSDHGDSGSVIVDGNNSVIGLLFAGAYGGRTWANPIDSVLNALQVRIG